MNTREMIGDFAGRTVAIDIGTGNDGTTSSTCQ